MTLTPNPAPTPQDRPNTPQSRGPQGQMIVEGVSFQGPLPHPATLDYYNRIVPGAAERIIKMAENQAGHRQVLEKRVITTSSITAIAGQVSGLIVALRAFTFAAEAIKQGHSATAITTVIATIAGLVSVFVYGKSRNTKQLRERAEQEK